MPQRTEIESLTTNGTTSGSQTDKTRDLHVKGVPEPIWRRARCNATNSGMTFKDYMITLLERSEPIGEPDRNQKSVTNWPSPATRTEHHD